jgi:hypothetical protein
MASEGLSSFNANQKAAPHTETVRGFIVEMQDNVSSGIFRCGSWTNSIDVNKDIRAEIVSIRMRAFCKHSGKRKTEWGPENGKHSVGAADCLPRPSWNRCSLRNPGMVGIIAKVEP